MAVANGTDAKTFTATIGRQNDTGFQISERPGKWLNFSKYSTRPELPPLGSIARITIDARGFVTSVTPLEPEQPPPPQLRPAASGASRIGRLALIKAAARFHAERSTSTIDDVVATAAAWEAWVEGAGG